LERQQYDSPYDTYGYVAKGKTTPVVSLAPAPSPAELKILKRRFLEAQKQTEHLEKELNEPVVIPPKCAHCAKYFEVTHGEAALKKAEEMEKTAKTRLQEAAAWEAAEEKRRRNLPAMALAMQREANLAYRHRVDAEKKALQAKIERVTIQKVEKVKLERLKEAVSRQRLVDRLRAAEDVRVAECAKKAATEAKRAALAEKKAALAALSHQTMQELKVIRFGADRFGDTGKESGNRGAEWNVGSFPTASSPGFKHNYWDYGAKAGTYGKFAIDEHIDKEEDDEDEEDSYDDEKDEGGDESDNEEDSYDDEKDEGGDEEDSYDDEKDEGGDEEDSYDDEEDEGGKKKCNKKKTKRAREEPMSSDCAAEMQNQQLDDLYAQCRTSLDFRKRCPQICCKT